MTWNLRDSDRDKMCESSTKETRGAKIRKGDHEKRRQKQAKQRTGQQRAQWLKANQGKKEWIHRHKIILERNEPAGAYTSPKSAQSKEN